jgi:uncharacterized protein YjiS (DUF1127 family)
MSINIFDLPYQGNSFLLLPSSIHIEPIEATKEDLTMSGHTITTHSAPRASLRAQFRLEAMFTALRQAWNDALRAAASRRNLQRMDDRMLSDIGISRAQAQFEASRWH